MAKVMALHFTGRNSGDLVSYMNRLTEQRRKKRLPKFLKNTFYSSYMVAVESALIDSLVQNFPTQPGEAISIQEIRGALEFVFTKSFADFAFSNQVFDGLKGIGETPASTAESINDTSRVLMEESILIAREGFPKDANVIEKIQYLDHIEKILSPTTYNAFIADMEDMVVQLPNELAEWKNKSPMPLSTKIVKWSDRWLPKCETSQ